MAWPCRPVTPTEQKVNPSIRVHFLFCIFASNIYDLMNNTVYILCAAALAAVAVLYQVAGKTRGNGKATASDAREPDTDSTHIPAGCCGKHAVCEKYGTKASAGSDDYFDDEELDQYKGRSSGSYTDKEVEEFRYVLYTMQQEEVISWIQSLQAREIELPDQLKEEAFFMMNETI